jgi:ParB-like chromosome segregation protein Spo0J
MTARLEQYDVIAVPRNRIYYDGSFNCRGEFTLQSVEALAESIREIGRLLCPIWLQPAVDVIGIPEGYDYRVIAGHRRVRAASVLGWTTIPATVFYGLTERQARLLNFTENLERKDLNPLEEALTIRQLYPNVVIEGDTASNRPRNATRITVEQVARELKRDKKWVNYRIRLLLVPEEVQQLIAARRVTLLDLEVICSKETPDAQIKAAQAIALSKRGRGQKAVFTGEKLTRSFRRRRSKGEINAKIAMMFNLGLEEKHPLALRMGAWCAGSISDEEFDANIFAEAGVIKSTDSCSDSDGRAQDH